MNYIPFLQAVISMGGIGLIFALLLMLANKKLKVEEDPRIENVEEWLPGANCGACGYPGCAACAEALVNQDVGIDICPVAGEEAKVKISEILGLELEKGTRQVAVLFCQGRNVKVKQNATYVGIETCQAATFANGGERACSYGCIGKGDCVTVCPFDAIHMESQGLPVIDRRKCTGCGNCVDACPRNIIELHPVDRHVFVLCKNKEKGKFARKVCQAACIACKICEKADESGGFIITDNLAVVDHEKYDQKYALPTDKCPNDCIVLVGEKNET